MSFLFSTPLPDELAQTHLYRVCAMNNLNYTRLLPQETKGLRPKNCNHPWTWIHMHHIMSDLSDMTPQAYRAHHTLMLLTKHWDKVYSQDPVKESTHSVYHYSQFQADSSGSTYEFKICPDCRKEDLRAFSMTYWHREHQIPGLDICPKHQTSLMKFESSCAWLTPNPVDIEGKIPSEALVMANFHPVVRRYQDIALCTLRNSSLVRFNRAQEKLLARAIELGICQERIRHTGHGSYLESHIPQYLYNNLPRAWMAEHFSANFLKDDFYPTEWSPDQYHTELDRLKSAGMAEPIFILLALATLFESTESICSILLEPANNLVLPRP
ncbi:TniQ family protein [Alcaligenaceae bacterium]|nr:TniQ family protein [Alcaligenaceae bacterium]